jgi:3-isopropylmalate/(R)-2-methylmalate dehydratase small subunit
MPTVIKGHIWKYGDDVNTDVIFPGKYTYTVTDQAEMAKHALEDLDPTFASSVQPGDVIVAGRNFGCGSSREQAAFCLKPSGVGAVVAKSFARLFFRNCINAGLPVIVQAGAADLVEKGQEITIDLAQGTITTQSGKVLSFPPLPEEVQGIVAAGGLVEWVKLVRQPR